MQTKSHTLVMYKNLEINYETVGTVKDADRPQCIALSLPVQVQFVLTSSSSQLAKHVDILQAKKSEIQAKCNVQIENIEMQIQELLALPAPGVKS